MVVYSTFSICFNFQLSFSRNKTTFAAIRHVLWALYTPKMRCGRSLMIDGFRARRMCLLAAGVIFSAMGELTERRKWKKEKGRHGWEKDNPRSLEIHFWLRPCMQIIYLKIKIKIKSSQDRRLRCIERSPNMYATD